MARVWREASPSVRPPSPWGASAWAGRGRSRAAACWRGRVQTRPTPCPGTALLPARDWTTLSQSKSELRWSGELCGRCAIHPLLVILLSNTCGNGTFSKQITLATSDKGSIVTYFFIQQIFNLPKCAHHCNILYCRIKYEIQLATSYFKCGWR